MVFVGVQIHTVAIVLVLQQFIEFVQFRLCVLPAGESKIPAFGWQKDWNACGSTTNVCKKHRKFARGSMISNNKTIDGISIAICEYLQMYPVKDVHDETTGTNLSDVRGFGGVMKLLWNQTWPLFVAPHLGNTFKLCYLMFILFSVGHGTAMW